MALVLTHCHLAWSFVLNTVPACRYLSDRTGFQRVIGVALLLMGVAYLCVGPAPPLSGGRTHTLTLHDRFTPDCKI